MLCAAIGSSPQKNIVGGKFYPSTYSWDLLLCFNPILQYTLFNSQLLCTPKSSVGWKVITWRYGRKISVYNIVTPMKKQNSPVLHIASVRSIKSPVNFNMHAPSRPFKLSHAG